MRCRTTKPVFLSAGHHLGVGIFLRRLPDDALGIVGAFLPGDADDDLPDFSGMVL